MVMACYRMKIIYKETAREVGKSKFCTYLFIVTIM